MRQSALTRRSFKHKDDTAGGSKPSPMGAESGDPTDPDSQTELGSIRSDGSLPRLRQSGLAHGTFKPALGRVLSPHVGAVSLSGFGLRPEPESGTRNGLVVAFAQPDRHADDGADVSVLGRHVVAQAREDYTEVVMLTEKLIADHIAYNEAIDQEKRERAGRASTVNDIPRDDDDDDGPLGPKLPVKGPVFITNYLAPAVRANRHYKQVAAQAEEKKRQSDIANRFVRALAQPSSKSTPKK